MANPKSEVPRPKAVITGSVPNPKHAIVNAPPTGPSAQTAKASMA